MANKYALKILLATACIISVVALYKAWLNLTVNELPPLEVQLTLPNPVVLKPDGTGKQGFNTEALNQQPSDPKILQAFNESLRKYADSQNNIAISLTDYGYMDMALNLYLSYKNVDLKNYLFVSSDNRSCSSLAVEIKDVHCVQYVFDADASAASNFGSTAFVRKTHRKTKIVLDALKLGFNILLVDLDIVLFKNPFPYFEKCPDCDLHVQWDHGMACSGFYYVRSTAAGISLMDTSWKLTLKNQKGLNDQKALNKAMKETKKTSKNYKQVILPENIFPNGFAYFHDKHIMFASDGPYPPDVYIVHDNWIISEAAKVYRFKEARMWFSDRGGYYSDPTRKYLVYSNAVLEVADINKLETDALKVALAIGNTLNRTVILPTFACKGCDVKRFKACAPKAGRCSLLTRYKIQNFDKEFAGQYREHVFLDHPLVPKSVVQSKSPVISIQSASNVKYASKGDNKELIKFTPKDAAKGATTNELLDWTKAHDSHSLLIFDTLYSAVNMDIIDNTFKERLQSAFKNSVYIQS